VRKKSSRRKPEQDEDPVARAEAQAVRFLTRRDYARRELSERLSTRGHGRAAIDAALERLDELGYLDDTRFAEQFVRSRIERGAGPVKIRAELSRRGVESEVCERALAGADCDFRSLALEVRIRRFGPETPKDLPEKARQARFLAQRGFAGDQVRHAVDADPA
jgi:regulatory protein